MLYVILYLYSLKVFEKLLEDKFMLHLFFLIFHKMELIFQVPHPFFISHPKNGDFPELPRISREGPA